MARTLQRSQARLDLEEGQGGPDFAAETQVAALYGRPVAGIDEAGRGPWAGPVVAAAAILDPGRPIPDGLNDSKKLTEPQRERLFDVIVAEAIAYGVGVATPAEIDQINIRRATHLAMVRATEALALGGVRPTAALVDGDDPPLLDIPTRALVRGRRSTPSIPATASPATRATAPPITRRPCCGSAPARSIASPSRRSRRRSRTGIPRSPEI